MKVILVGAGRIGKRHADHIKDYGNLIGVCDIDENEGRLLASENNCPY